MVTPVTATETTGTATAAAAVALAANPTREKLMLQNQHATDDLLFGFTTGTPFILRTGETLFLDNSPRDALYVKRGGGNDIQFAVLETVK